MSMSIIGRIEDQLTKTTMGEALALPQEETSVYQKQKHSRCLQEESR